MSIASDGLNDQQVREIINSYKNIAVVGLSPDASKPSHNVTAYMIKHGFSIVGVRPGHSGKILNQPVYEKLADVKEAFEVVVVFRAPEFIPHVIDEILKTKAKVVWLQLGITHPAAEEKARRAGLTVVSDRCFLIEHRRL